MTLITDPERNENKYLHQFADFAGKRVIEIGSGEGRLTWQYANPTKFTIGIDPNADAVRVATIDRPSNLSNKVLLVQAQSEFLPFKKETFDLAVLAWTF